MVDVYTIDDSEMVEFGEGCEWIRNASGVDRSYSNHTEPDFKTLKKILKKARKPEHLALLKAVVEMQGAGFFTTNPLMPAKKLKKMKKHLRKTLP